MKKVFIKTIALFFLSILLTSNVLNLHVFFHDHEHDHDHYFGNLGEHHNDENNAPCDLCLLVLNLNNLDYNKGLEFSFESDNLIINNFKKDLLVYKRSYYKELFSKHNRNKAPPHLI